MLINQYGQPVGDVVTDWQPTGIPSGQTLQGRFCRLEALDAQRHDEKLFAAYQQTPDGRDWTYLPAERPENALLPTIPN